MDSTALIVGDFSNGNDGVVLKGKGKKLADIKGQSVNLVELSVSHYLLARGLEIGRARGARHQGGEHLGCGHRRRLRRRRRRPPSVTWKPQLSEVTAMPKTTLVFDSSKIPGEIIDLMVVNSATLKANPKLGKALVGAWYETLAVMQARTRRPPTALDVDGQGLGHRPRRLQGPARDHLACSATPADAYAFTTSPDLVKTMDLVRKFSFDHGLLGEGAKTVDAVGIEFPGGKTLGDARTSRCASTRAS